ncbi:hypothetical protein PtA15_3A203 [Puccinia triticina]|uniref:GATA-type domain-containing protein n=1 Tax=Puccinia triticina TaxID=208348 RepID=A0ABY7CDR7_9BASI|nr:uncharacterized protein PtA15_3A203 [Puccinia triticina]WAQ82839.1 hypothetical protein PtA15_3A203 [Puccinia triticina]
MFSPSYQHPQSTRPPSHTEPRHQHAKQTKPQPPAGQSQPAKEASHQIRQPSISSSTATVVPRSTPQQQASTPQKARQPSGSSPICANCETETTPLWRRNQSGATLCNACALFQKMKGRPRPISLKTNVIKPRNRIKAIDRMPASARPARPLANTGSHHPGRLNTSASSTSSSSCSTPIHPTSSSLYHHHHQQPNLIQQATSRLNNNTQDSPPSSANTAPAYLHPDQAYRKAGPSHSNGSVFRFNPQPLANSSALNLPSHHIGHSQSVPSEPGSLFRAKTHSTRKSLPGGPDPFSQPLSLSDQSVLQPKRRKQSLNAPTRATPTENTFPVTRAFSGPPRLPTPHVSSDSFAPRLQSPNSGYSPPIRRQHQIPHDHQQSPTDDHPTFQQFPTDRRSTIDREKPEEREKMQCTVGVDRRRFSPSPIVLPPLSQLTQHLSEPAKLPPMLRTTELGPPKSFEASAREARLHSPVSPHGNLLAIPAGRAAEPRRALSVHSSVSDPDSVLSPIRISSPSVYDSSPSDQQTRQRQTEPPITPPVFLGYPASFHRRASGPSRPLTGQPTIEFADALHPHSSNEACHDNAPVEELCQLKKRIAELELINGRMVNRLGELERRPNSSPAGPYNLLSRDQDDEKEENHSSIVGSDNEVSLHITGQDPSENHHEEDEEDMIDANY